MMSETPGESKRKKRAFQSEVGQLTYEKNFLSRIYRSYLNICWNKFAHYVSPLPKLKPKQKLTQRPKPKQKPKLKVKRKLKQKQRSKLKLRRKLK